MLNRYVDWVIDNIIGNDQVMKTVLVLLGTVVVGLIVLAGIGIMIKAVF